MNSFRTDIVDLIRGILEPMPDVLALLEGGSAAFERTDEFSDADVMAIVPDDDAAVANVFEVVERELARSMPVRRCWRIPEPAWHGHSQRIYQFDEAEPWQWLDLAVMRVGARDLFTSPEEHGHTHVLFDRTGVATPPDFNAEAHRERMRADFTQLVDAFDLMQPLVEKQLRRRNALAAIEYYHGGTLLRLVKLLAMKYAPLRYNHGIKHVAPYFPEDVQQAVESLAYIRDLDDLIVKHPQAIARFHETAASLDIDALDIAARSRAVRG